MISPSRSEFYFNDEWSFAIDYVRNTGKVIRNNINYSAYILYDFPAMSADGCRFMSELFLLVARTLESKP